MTLWLALRRLLPLLAALSLALTPVTASAATVGLHASMASSHHATVMGDHAMAGMDHAAMGHHAAVTADMADPGMDEMPCCPKAEAAKPDCGRDCPLMALCLASLTSLPPAALRIPTPVAKRASPTWPEPGSLSSVLRPPLPEPPRA